MVRQASTPPATGTEGRRGAYSFRADDAPCATTGHRDPTRPSEVRVIAQALMRLMMAAAVKPGWLPTDLTGLNLWIEPDSHVSFSGSDVTGANDRSGT